MLIDASNKGATRWVSYTLLYTDFIPGAANSSYSHNFANLPARSAILAAKAKLKTSFSLGETSDILLSIGRTDSTMLDVYIPAFDVTADPYIKPLIPVTDYFSDDDSTTFIAYLQTPGNLVQYLVAGEIEISFLITDMP